MVFPRKKKRSPDAEERAKAQFLDILALFRRSILHDPSSPLQLFHFVNEQTEYKAKYGDVRRCYDAAVSQKWFRPMKRTKKGGTTKDGGDDEEGARFVLEIDEEAERRERAKEERKEPVVPEDSMDDEAFTVLLAGYSAKYENPPRNAVQIMNFAKEQGQHFKYKACRVAFLRWKNIWSAS